MVQVLHNSLLTNNIDTQGGLFMSDQANLSIGDVSKITGLPAYTIRYWEKEFLVFLRPDRTSGLQRRYSERDIEIIEEIRHLLKVEGFSIAGAKRQLSQRYTKSEEAAAPDAVMLNEQPVGNEVISEVH